MYYFNKVFLKVYCNRNFCITYVLFPTDGPKPHQADLSTRFGIIGKPINITFYIRANPAPRVTACNNRNRHTPTQPVKVIDPPVADLHRFYMVFKSVEESDFSTQFTCEVSNGIGNAILFNAALSKASE